ncbi:Uncharacterised protein [Mycoplasmopsis glycophila]|uniref:Uncharacterized protein n=2 Tax=Mycoplasmopsis glycophila TaxID=171285 RepID=A0A449AVN5_9BACT|nr:Uncharacterised protein [Mycoplasmopsis glycophila]
MNSDYLIHTINFENSRRIQNQTYTTKIAINDRPKIREEYEKSQITFKLLISKILGESKNVNLYLDLTSKVNKYTKGQLFINGKALIESASLKQYISVDHTKADIPFDKIKRIDFYLYSDVERNAIMAKYTILFSDFEKIKLKTSNQYRENFLEIPYLTFFEFKDKGCKIDEASSMVRVLWNDLPIDNPTNKIACIELYNIKLAYSLGLKNYEKAGFMNLKDSSFIFKPFLKNFLNAQLRKNSQSTSENKMVYDVYLNDNFTVNTNLTNLSIDLDNTILKGLLVPKKYDKEMQWTLKLENDFFNWELTYLFENELPKIDTANLIRKPILQITELEISQRDFVNFEFEFPMARYEFFIKQENWDFSWFIKRDAYRVEWN